MPTLKIDGREITVKDGTRVIEAADALGIPIPRFCYHPGLPVAANCRMCLVETNRAPKPVPSCHDFCGDGMEVQTATEKVIEARRAVLEYILLNHPVDCPTCDQAGECDLQDQYFEYDHKPSRHAFRKAHKPKARAIGPRVVYDAERCINCTRCVRFCEDIAGAPQLRQIQRGEKAYIDVFPGTELDNPYSMCAADVCPVGALTVRDFRFKCRVWFMKGTQSVCGECSRGCSVRVDTYKNEVQRIVPRHNPNVNQYWACDAGRTAFHSFDEGRLEAARVRGRDTDFDQALDQFAHDLEEALGKGLTPAVILSPFMTCEDAFAAISLFKTKAPGAVYSIGGREDGEADEVLIRADRNPNRAGLKMILDSFGIETAPIKTLHEAAHPVVIAFGYEFEERNYAKMAVQAAQLSAVFASMDVIGDVETYAFPAVSPYETYGTWVNEFGVIQRVRPAVKAPEAAKQARRFIADLAERLGAPLGDASLVGIFGLMTEEIEEFKGLELDAVGPFGIKLWEDAADVEAETDAGGDEAEPEEAAKESGESNKTDSAEEA
ncbi:MAG: ferredoxin [Deltaproteobacteria bacterium]|nr:ferredoxin [Deltaproteobacteria bacterium]